LRWLAVNDCERRKSLRSLHGAEPGKQHVEHATNIVHCVDTPSVNGLVGSELVVGTIYATESNAVLESDKFFGYV
jgi:hypothetical protein